MSKIQKLEKHKYNDEINNILERYSVAKDKRSPWESIIKDCYEYALPQQSIFTKASSSAGKISNELYDATALDAVDQLAASLLGHLTPAWSQWFGFKAGPDLNTEEYSNISPILEDIAKKIQSHLDRSNFIVEMHQCFLDLAVGGTATLCVEETQPGSDSALKFSAIPLHNIVLEEGADGFLKGSYRNISLTLGQISKRYSDLELPPKVISEGTKNPQHKFSMVESILPKENFYEFHAILMSDSHPYLISSGRFEQSPIISFRWMKSPGEIYGRSPVMKALPDIKTANKVVELILKNASIAVTGIWQADDDGVLNPSNIELVPGAIIPKAVGSQGLRPLDMPGRFDVSELVLKDLRSRIRHALLSDKLGPVVGQKMTATEVLERSSQMALLLGATYGRLQSELLSPLIHRVFGILKRRGEIPDIDLDNRTICIDFRSPLAKAQSQGSIQNIVTWLNLMSSLGPQASLLIDTQKIANHLAETLGVPNDFVSQMSLPISDDLLSVMSSAAEVENV